MDPQTQYYLSNYGGKSETFLKLESLCQDIKKSWFQDCDETDSMKEIIEIINGILIMESLEEYFSNNKKELDYFMGDFSKDVINNIMLQPVIFGENGDEIGLDLLYHFIKLFMKFHNNKEYSPLFEKIRNIFSTNINSLFNPNSRTIKKENNPKKEYTNNQFNEEFCKDFKKEKANKDTFKIGDKVDVLIKCERSSSSLGNDAWVQGKIIDIIDNEYIIEYPNKEIYGRKKRYPFDSPYVLKQGKKTEDWEWRLSLKENDVIDCYDRGKWYPSTIGKVNETLDENGNIIYKDYRVGFRLYTDNFLGNDYDTLFQNTIFWDNTDNQVDSNGKSYYGDNSGMDETLPFYSKRIQKFKKYTSIQREVLQNKYNNLFNYNMNNIGNNNSLSIMNQKTEGEEKIKIMTDLLKNDKDDENNIEDLYLFEKDGKKNYIIGKDPDNFYYYFAILLKRMADDGYFEKMINILKEKPNQEELYNIFYILMNCTFYIHKDFYKINYEIFKNAFYNMMENLSSKDMRSFHKDVIELANNFFIKINHLIYHNKMWDMNEINLTLAIKMIKSPIFDKKMQGLKSLGELLKNASEEEQKTNIINLIKKYGIINEIFGPNYHVQILSKSNDIFEIMLKNNELTEEEIKKIWSLTEQGDLEAKKIIIKLLLDSTSYINEKYSNILLECIKNEKEKKLNENEIELIYNLAMKSNNENFLLEYCERYCKNILEITNLKDLAKSPFVDNLVNLFSKGEKYCKIIIDFCEKYLTLNKNVLQILFLLDKIIEKNKKNIKIYSDNKSEINKNDFINNCIHILIDNDKLLNLFKNIFILYKKNAKENIGNKNENNLVIDGYSHQDNMKNRISFLVKIIPVLYPKFDFLELLKEICINNPIFKSDKIFFYDFMKKYISEKSEDTNSKEQKIKIETQLFNMLSQENKTELNLSQYNLYIEIFLDINNSKELLIYSKNPNGGYIININNNVNIDDIFGIDKLWDLLFQLENEDLTQRSIKFIYNLYKNKNEIQKLLEKCVKIIKNTDNITYNILEKCINILKFIILESEKNELIQIKSHFELLKECVINISIELKKDNNNNMSNISLILKPNKGFDNLIRKKLLYGNMSLMELKMVIEENNNFDSKSLNVDYVYKEKNNNLKTKILDSSYNNKTLLEILNINDDNIEKRNKLISNKFIFKGEKKESKPFIIGMHNLNPKFETMIKEWFYNFSKGSEIMEKDSALNYVSYITSNPNIDENDINFIQFMNECDKGRKDFILEEEFIEYYTNLSRFHEDTIREHMKIMKYNEDFKKINESPSIPINTDKNSFPRYILGNNKEFHDVLIQLFSKYDKKLPIYEFLFFLCTNEEEYFELLNNFENLFKGMESGNINYLEYFYKLIIFESFIQDLEASQDDIISNFTVRKDNKIVLKENHPFDDESNLSKKKCFIINFIENGGYNKLIHVTEDLLESIYNNNKDDEQIKYKCCEMSLGIINSIYNSFISKDLDKKNKTKTDIYYLGNSLDINSIIKNENDNTEENKIDKLKQIILNSVNINLIKNMISFLLKSQKCLNSHSLYNSCFNLLMKLITNNESLSCQIKKDDSIKENLSSLINSNITSLNDNDKFFLKSLNKFIKDLSDNKKSLSNLEFDFLNILFKISIATFKQLLKNDENSNSYTLFYDFFNNLFKILLNNKNTNENCKLENEFITHVYELIYKYVKEEEKCEKLKEDEVLGFMQILITAIKSDKSLKKEIISKEIDGETLFDLIYNKITPQNNNNEINNDGINITDLILNLDDNPSKIKYFNMENLNELIGNIFTNNHDKKNIEMSQQIYDIFNNFILVCFSGTTDMKLISKLLKLISSKENSLNFQQNNSQKKKYPKVYGHVGLKNIGCICYMNSILQQMYMVPSFRYAIMSADDKKSEKNQSSLFSNNIFDDNLLHQLQKMYTFLTYSEKQAYNPKDFCESFKDFEGMPINPKVQQDSQEFFNNFCDKIENSLKDTKYKYIIDNIFTGKTCSSVMCEKCNTVSNKFEDFYNLTLEVKNIGNLYESLQRFIEPERIEQFNCEVCKEKVTISKKASLAKLPNVLFIHLKRFYMNYDNDFAITEKINSKFEFPNILNLKKFCSEEVNKDKNGILKETEEIYPKEEEFYEYELKGINVHMGDAQGGHYISFIDVERDGKNNEPNIKSSIENGKIQTKWLKFNDSIVSLFNTEEIPIESFGNNESIQNAYLLIYERKKKTPIKIIVDKENVNYLANREKYLYNNNVIFFGKKEKPSINKFYDISYYNKEAKVKEEDLYNKIFIEEEIKECYSYVPYYNIDKNVSKKYFIEVMEKNQKFFNKKIIPMENNKFKNEFNDVLLDIIRLDDFNILNNKFSFTEKDQLISIIKEKIFNKIKNDNNFADDEANKIIINEQLNILIEKIIFPIINSQKEDNFEINILKNSISNILLSSENLKIIFENEDSKRIFDIDKVQKMSDIIYSLFNYENKENNIKSLFLRIYNIIDEIDDSPNNMFIDGETINITKNKKDKKKEKTKSPLFYLYELIYKTLNLDNDVCELLIPRHQISNLLYKLNSINNIEIREIIYDIIMHLIDYSCDYKEERDLNSFEKQKIKKRVYNSKDLVKKLFDEKMELLIKLIKIIQYNDCESSNKFNKEITQYLFNYAIKAHKLTKMLDLLYEIINIPDMYTLNRLYSIMGFPELLMVNQNKNENNEKEKLKEEKNNKFCPLFGYRLLEQSNNGEIYKYVNYLKIFETHCILSQLFPCTNDDFYDNLTECEDEQKLNTEEKNKYIYKLICVALLEEGNYPLFKYIYLTPSRFGIKYNNLYEEIIDILSKDNKYDLTEIKKNADMCIKRVNYEIKRIKIKIFSETNKKLDDEEDNEKEEENPFKIPPLPEKMEKKYKENEELDEFTGFIASDLPDKIEKVEYNTYKSGKRIIITRVKYYTTFKSIQSIRNKKEDNKEHEKDIKKDEIIEKKEEKDDDIKEAKDITEKEEQESDNIILDLNEIKFNERDFLDNYFDDLFNEKNIVLKDKKFKKNGNTNLSFVRLILFTKLENNFILRDNIEKMLFSLEMKCNCYIPNISICEVKNYLADFIRIYRKSQKLDFIDDNSINDNISYRAKNKPLENFLSGWNSDND